MNADLLQAYGCVLIVELTPHCKRLFSVPPAFESRSLAKKECSTEAIAQGIIEFIKHGNGQAKPATPTAKTLLENLDAANGNEGKEETSSGEKGRKGALSLQVFFDSLPKPFPEEVKAEVETISAVGILNSTLQTAKGAKLTLDWFFVNEHGCECFIPIFTSGNLELRRSHSTWRYHSPLSPLRSSHIHG